jgi:hypothetical protein
VGYALPDHLGSVRQVADAAGQVSLAQSYDPFGDLISQFTNVPVSQPSGYTPLWGTGWRVVGCPGGVAICGHGDMRQRPGRS